MDQTTHHRPDNQDMLSERTSENGAVYFQHQSLCRPGINHGFFTSRGGVSTGLYTSLNCGPGSDDDPAHIQQNRERICASLDKPSSHLHGLYQVHSATCLTITAPPPFAPDDRPEADALVTDQPDVVLGILTADCLPVLFTDPDALIIGAAHAGWRGADAGVIEATIDQMEACGARRERIIAVIGPAIQRRSYQIDSGMAKSLSGRHDGAADCFGPDPSAPGKMLFDLPLFAMQIMRHHGLTHIWTTGLDSYSDSSRFFSHRRATHKSEPDSGRLISAICLNR